MKGYIIKAPGKPPQLMTVGTDATRTARESNGTSEPIIVPDTKLELVPWINELVATAVADARAEVLMNRGPLKPETVERIAAGLTAHLTSPAMNPEPPMPEPTGDSITPREMVRLINEDRASEAVAGYVKGLDSWRLGVVIDACLCRMSRLRRELAGAR